MHLAKKNKEPKQNPQCNNVLIIYFLLTKRKKENIFLHFFVWNGYSNFV
jgi:hypothetical protein